MRIVIEKGIARGSVKAPPSKSMAHRLLICAAMSEGVSTVRDVSSCEDVAATLDCMASMGIRAEKNGNDVTVWGKDPKDIKPTSSLFCKESGSTLRFLLPISLISGRTTMFLGDAGLMRRPMNVYEDLCKDKGMVYLADGESITVRGPLKPGEFSVVGNISSQFISGLIFALPNLDGDSRIRITPPIESRSYIDLTLDALRMFGIEARWENEYTVFIKGNQKYTPTDVRVEGDYSGAAFPDALNLFGSEVCVEGLNPDSIQGDSIYKKYYSMLDCGIPTIGIGDCPDLGPILFAVAAAKCGGVFSGTKRLKIKESDRAAAMAEELKKFGSSVSVYDDKVVIYPKSFHAPTEPLNGHGDHRIVMALAIISTVTGAEIEGAEAINKSYPDFFSDLKSLGIGVIEYEA